MPSDPKAKSKSQAEVKAKSSREKSSKQSSSRSSSKKLTSSSSSSSKSLSSRSKSGQSEDDKLFLSYLKSHSGYLRPLILSISTTTSISPKIVSIVILAIFMVLHLFLPLFILPHLSAVLTLFIPIQNTVTCAGIVSEKNSKKGDSAQWLLYWIIYCLLGWIRGGIQIWLPNLRGIFEIARSAILIVLGGPWFGRAALRPEQGGSSSDSKKRSASSSSSKAKQQKDEKAKRESKKSK